MKIGTPFTVSLLCWRDGEPLLKSIREAVFIREQGVPEALEWDGLDESCRHALALSLQGDAIGCGRMLPDGHIGHIAVLPQWRKQKAGTAIMEALLDYARAHDYPQVSVDVQSHYAPFYQSLGFVEQGEASGNAVLPHIKMFLEF
ncbi:MAG TPA: GNAT family N-acetyltransferase [Gallionella sp.]|nr:GNAT family N-acetyltransferase [Gallionella sp.]